MREQTKALEHLLQNHVAPAHNKKAPLSYRPYRSLYPPLSRSVYGFAPSRHSLSHRPQATFQTSRPSINDMSHVDLDSVKTLLPDYSLVPPLTDVSTKNKAEEENALFYKLGRRIQESTVASGPFLHVI